MVSEQTIAFESVTKAYGSFKAVDDLTAGVERGGVWALLGPNGAGKTTLLKCMLGLINFTGKITIEGFDVSSKGKSARGMVGYVPQRPSLYENLSVMETLRFFADMRSVKRSRITELLEFVGLELWGRAAVGALSSGMAQRLMLAIALLSDPPTLLLDEPTANLDVRRQLEFRSLLNVLVGEGKTIMLTTHLLGDVDQIARNIMVMNKGKLVATVSTNELMDQLDLSAQLYIELKDEGSTDKAMSVLEKAGAKDVSIKNGWMVMGVDPTIKLKILNLLNEGGVVIKDFKVDEPNLEDAFLRLTGEADVN